MTTVPIKSNSHNACYTCRRESRRRRADMGKGAWAAHKPCHTRWIFIFFIFFFAWKPCHTRWVQNIVLFKYQTFFLAPIVDFHPIPSVPRIAFGATCILDLRFIFRNRILLFDSQQHLPCGSPMQNHICLEVLWRTLNPFHLFKLIILYANYFHWIKD